MSTPETWTFDEHRDVVLAAVRRQERALGAGEDWPPVLLLDAGRIVLEVPVGIIDVTSLQGFMRDAMTNLALTYEAKWFARVQAVWSVARRAEDPQPPAGSIASHPDAEERVVVLVGNRERHEVWMARVYRANRRARPKLGPWEMAQLHQPDAATDGILDASSGLRPTDG